MRPTIGVLITYYDEKELLTECIQSLLQGNDVPDEILVYDDASQYPAENYAPKHPHIQIFRGNVNQGPSYGRNILLNASKCDYIHFHDADDLFHPNWLTAIRHTAIISRYDIIVTGCSQISEDGTIVTNDIFDYSILELNNDITALFLGGSSNTLTVTFLRELGLKNGGYHTHDLKAALDYYFNVRIASISTNYTVINQPLAIERLRAKSLTRAETGRLSPKHRLETIKALTYLKQELPPQYYHHIVELAAQLSSILFHMKKYDEARKGFDFALSVGKPTYSYQSRPYRVIARSLGPLMAEKITSTYRSFLPYVIRKKLYQTLNR